MSHQGEKISIEPGNLCYISFTGNCQKFQIEASVGTELFLTR